MLRVLGVLALLSVLVAFLAAPAAAGPSDPSSSNSNGDHDIPQIGDLHQVRDAEVWESGAHGPMVGGCGSSDVSPATLAAELWARQWLRIWVQLQGL